MLLNVILLLNLFTPKKIAFLAVLMISMAALAIACYVLIRLLQQEKENNEYAPNGRKDIDPSYLAGIVVNSTRVRKYITETVQTLVAQEMRKASNNPSEALVSKVSDVILECIRLEEKEKAGYKEINLQQQNTTVSIEVPPQKPVLPIYYATAVEEGNHTFYNVATEPTKGETIFKFTEIQRGRCEFEVFESAYNMVLKESEYLNGACILDKLGNSKVITTKRGIAELNTEGKWVVKEPAKVKFE